MKRLLLVFLFFSSIVVGMDRIEAFRLLEKQMQTKQEKEKAEQLGNVLTKKLAQLADQPSSYSPEQSKQVIEEAKNLILQGADVNEIYEFKFIDHIRFYYPTTSAIKLNDPGLVKLLLEHGAHVNHRELLHSLAQSYHQPNSVIAEKNAEIAKLLIEYGVNINEQSLTRKDTPLIRAVVHQNVPLVRLLVEGVDTQPIRQFEQLPEDIKKKMYLGLLISDVKCTVYKHLKIKADPNLINLDNKTALDIARDNLQHSQNDPEFFRNIDNEQRIRDYQEIIRILEPVTSLVPIAPAQQAQPTQRSWWQRWRR